MTNNSQTRMERRKQQKSKKKPIWKKIAFYTLLVILAIGISIAGLFTYYIATAPKLDVEKLAIPFSSQYYDMDGNLIGDLAGDEQRKKVTFDDLPEILIDAITATEDVRFFSHMGIDLRRIGGAIKANITRGFGAEGASTITQQVVENSFLTSDKKLKRKVQEQWLSLKLEREYSKEEILELYLNKINFGSGAYGVGKAAEVYFGKTDLHDLTLIEAAILAGLPQRPSAYNPYENPDLMAGRVDTVLKLMVRHGKITEEEANEAREVDIPSLLVGKRPKASSYEAFIQKVREEVKTKVDGADIYTDGLKIYTTLDPKAQEHVEFLLTDSENNPINYVTDDLQAAMTILDTKSGAIRAIGGGRNKDNIDGFNFAIQGGRQPGSTFKPLLVYGPAIEHHNISTYHQLNDDAPYDVPGSTPIRNVSRTYKGWVSARTALKESINVPTVKLFDEIGKESGYQQSKEFAERLGIKFANDSINVREAIGGHETDVNPLQLAGAFRPFGNEGIYNEPYAVTRVEFPDGKVVELQPEPKAVMADYTAYMVTDMLKDVLTSGSGTSANIPSLPVAGKTGTTNLPDNLGGGANNSWFVGYTTNYTISAWVGYEKSNRALLDSNDAQGSQLGIARALFKDAMTKMSEGIETADFVKPSSVVEVAIERGTNPPQLPSKYTPKENVITELFVKGHEPSKISEKYDRIEPVENLKAKYDENDELIEVTWDHLDDDVIFEISASIDGGTMKVLSTTDNNHLDITNVDQGATYDIQVVVLDEKDHSKKSEPKTTRVKIPERTEENDENDEDQDDDENDDQDDNRGLSAVENLKAYYDESSALIDVSWDYNGPPAKYIVNVNGQEQTVEGKGLEIADAEPGNTYTITVTTIGLKGSNEGKKGPSKSVELTIEQDEDIDHNNNDS